MELNNTVNEVRIRDNIHLTRRQKLLRVVYPIIFGVIIGFLSKYVDTIPQVGVVGEFLDMVSNISSRIGIWILIATVIAVWSRTPSAAALHVFAFFGAMLLTYYIYAILLFGFFPTYYFLRWGGIAIVSPIAAYIVWYSRGKGWIAAVLGALPIGMLLATGYGFFYTLSVPQGADLLFAIVLFVWLPGFRQKAQYLRLIVPSLLIGFVLREWNLLSYLFGGL